MFEFGMDFRNVMAWISEVFRNGLFNIPEKGGNL